MNYFEARVKYLKIAESGKEIKVTEDFVTKSIMFSESENRVIKEMEPFLGKEFEISAIKKAPYSDIFRTGQENPFFKCKVSFVTIDEEKGKEKKTTVYMLQEAKTVDEAYKLLTENMEDSCVDYEINAVTETKIVDILDFE